MPYMWLTNDYFMALTELLRTGATLLVGGLGALIGALLLWKYYALPKISRWIVEQGSGRIQAWLSAVIEHPDGEEGKQVGRMAGVAFSYILDGLEELVSTTEGHERLKPIMEVVQQHISQSIYASWGHILEKLREGGEGLPSIPGVSLPPEILGMAGKMFPGIDMNQALGLLKWAGPLLHPESGNGSGAKSSGSSFTLR